MKLDAQEAHYVLQALLARRKVALRHVREILRDRELERLGAAVASKAVGTAARATVRTRRRLSPKVRALRRQQGRYMGLVRRLKAAEKARVRALREKKGLPAAIRLALSLGRS
jgi:hypothetical protein